MNNNYVSVAVIIVAVLVGSFLFKPTVNVVTSQPLGVVPGGDFTNPATFASGATFKTQVASTSLGSQTITAAEFKRWAEAGQVSYAPGLLAGGTLTFPASSTLASLVPSAGDRTSFCIRNATSTASIVVTLAGGTGTNLLVASSTATAVGSKALLTGKVGCVTLTRQASTASSYDIDALLTVFN